MNDETTLHDAREKRNRADGMAPARGAVLGSLFGAFLWLIAFACWKFVV